MARRRAGLGALALGFGLVLAQGCDRAAEEPSADAPVKIESEELDPALAARLPAGVTFQEVQQGRELFAVCATCHGFDGAGTQLGPSLRDAEHIHTGGELEQIAQIIRAGVAEPEEFEIPMPVMGGGDFTEEQVRALAAYVYLLGQPAS